MLFFKLRRRPRSHLCRANYLLHGSKKQDQIMYARTNKIYPLLVLCLCIVFLQMQMRVSQKWWQCVYNEMRARGGKREKWIVSSR